MSQTKEVTLFWVHVVFDGLYLIFSSRHVVVKVAPYDLIVSNLNPYADPAATLVKTDRAEVEPNSLRKELTWKLSLPCLAFENHLSKEPTIYQEIEASA